MMPKLSQSLMYMAAKIYYVDMLACTVHHHMLRYHMHGNTCFCLSPTSDPMLLLCMESAPKHQRGIYNA